jgi:hypothetical protein
VPRPRWPRKPPRSCARRKRGGRPEGKGPATARLGRLAGVVMIGAVITVMVMRGAGRG